MPALEPKPQPPSPGFLLLDTTVLSNFASVGELTLLREVLKRKELQPLITPQVQVEFQRGVEKGLFADTDISWIEVIELTEQEAQTFRRLQEVFGQGEAACLAVALERNLPLATDDMMARDVARRRGVIITGTLGILGWAVKSGLLSLARGDEILKAMREKGYFSPVESLRELEQKGE